MSGRAEQRAMRILVCLSAALIVASFARIALTEPAGEKSASLDGFGFLDEIPPAPREMPPAPDREAPEYARKSWEIIPNVGWTLPSCKAVDVGGNTCIGVGSGISFGISGVYRITPHAALGAEVEIAEFGYDSPAAGVSGASRAGHFGPIFRTYFLERGFVDPWVQVGFGMGAASTSYANTRGDLSVTASGAAVSAAAGVDFWVTPFLKVGPSVGQQVVFPTEVRVCWNDECSSYTAREAGGMRRWLRLGLVATVAFGQEM